MTCDYFALNRTKLSEIRCEFWQLVLVDPFGPTSYSYAKFEPIVPGGLYASALRLIGLDDTTLKLYGTLAPTGSTAVAPTGAATPVTSNNCGSAKVPR